ncbi:MAG: type pilus assembly protein PilB [Solirubrobacterales bacterium]|jgi:type IV pilus assembly protein PilB|nr:type pilus assembly protein PilB [Solirubrobacterales bacterium]
MTERPDYLKPVPDTAVPDTDGATALAHQPKAAPAQAESVPAEVPASVPGTAGLTPPIGKAHSGMFITDVLVELGYVDKERAQLAVEEARGAGRTPESILVEQKVIDSNQLSRAVAERYGLYHLDLNSYKVDMGASNLISPAAARRYNAVPVGFMPDDTVLLAMSDPSDVIAIDDVQMITGSICRVAVAGPEDIEALIRRLNTLDSAVSEAVDEEDEISGEEVTDLRESADDAPVIKLVYSILGQATNDGASDVHFEPQDGEMRVRFRVDGVLIEAARVPKRMVAGVISRIKIMSDMDIAEKRVPQDGRVSLNVEGRKVDLRITTLPTSRGEGCTIRILDTESALRSLDELGMDGEGRTRYETSYRKPYGAILVTGPTGSGKSTSLYATLNEINSVEKKIITIEDPVEYRMDGINQMGVNRRAGLTFATGLRSMLRADPDVIMVGEIRDGETARIAIEAALTGHLVLTTLHTNDAPGAIVRLQKMGIESFLTASAVDCVVAQRLARKLCDLCKKQAVMPKKALIDAGYDVDGDLTVFEPVGCARCGGSGYRGRIGLYSVMVMSEALKEMTVSGATEAELTAVARQEGMITLPEDGLRKVEAGVTSIEEVARVAR